MDAEALVRPVIESAGLELVEVSFARENGRRVLRVIADRPGGVDVDTLATLSEQVSRRLDGEAFEPGGPYALEVSSPGIERPLRHPEQFRRAVGSKVTVRTASAMVGSTRHSGTLLHADDQAITLRVADGDLRVPYDAVASARTVADWDAELKRSHA